MYKPNSLQTITYFSPSSFSINSKDDAYKKYRVILQVISNEILFDIPDVRPFYKSWLEIIHSRNLTGLDPKDFYFDALKNL